MQNRFSKFGFGCSFPKNHHFVSELEKYGFGLDWHKIGRLVSQLFLRSLTSGIIIISAK